MRKKKRTYKNIRTHAEMRDNEVLYVDGVRERWARGKRAPYTLDPWNNEHQNKHQRSWKMFREKQYRVGKRGKRHELILDDKCYWSKIWNFQEYCRKHDIPFTSERLFHLEWYWQYKKMVWTFLYWLPCYIIQKVDGKWQSVLDKRPVYDYVYSDLPEPIRRCRRIDDGYKLVWWSNKDIGIDYIMPTWQI